MFHWGSKSALTGLFATLSHLGLCCFFFFSFPLHILKLVVSILSTIFHPLVLCRLLLMGTFHLTIIFHLNFWQLPVANGTVFSKISKKRATSQAIPKFSETFPRLVFFPFNFAPRISGIFCWMVCILEIWQFLEFVETFPFQEISVPFAAVSKF